jgi:hypothetical protein
VHEYRFLNQSLPQTLQIATLLLYFRAVFSLVFVPWGLLSLVFAAATGAAGFGIANEKRWGYVLGIVMAALAILGSLPIGLSSGTGFLSFLLYIIWDVALFALLVHPQSRDYQRVWFK